MYITIKRILDLIFSLSLLITLIPLFLIVALVILASMGFPVLFRQYRIGLNNKLFMIYKFRTMARNNEAYITDKARITKVGRILRLFRIDELPQLFNILIGDMSFIGPRPLLPQYLSHYSEEELRRHNVRPGLSGLSQVSSLNYIEWDQQFEYDVYYVDNISLKLDIYIFSKTILKIIRPISMINSGITGGRLNFDTYRKLQLEKNKDLNKFSKRNHIN